MKRIAAPDLEERHYLFSVVLDTAMQVFASSFWGVTPSLVLLASLLGLSAITGAQDPHGDGAPPATLDDLLAFLDRDRDGSIEAFEGAEAFLFLTQEADLNGDAALSVAEIRTYLDANKAEEARERRDHFERFDEDKNGRLVIAEIPMEYHGMFHLADVNSDGELTLPELLAAKSLENPKQELEQEVLGFFAEVDEDGDGSFSLGDLSFLQRIQFADEFKAMDLDANGSVTQAELLSMLQEEMRGAEFEVCGSDAIMTGVIGASTPGRVLQLLVEHPEVERVVMEKVPGSMDDHSMLRAARLLRRGRLDTRVPKDGEVASGGTDFFQAGVTRTKGAGARFGIHSWSGGADREGADFPKEHVEHVKYVEYCREMGIPEAFYWHTLVVAPSDDIHWMTGEEIERFRILTEDGPEDDDGSDERGGTLIGGCVLREPAAKAPKVLRQVTAASNVKHLGPFSKTVIACGITLAAEEKVPDEFLQSVGQVILEIFRTDQGVDVKLQDQVLTNLYVYRTLLPVPRTEATFETIMHADPEAFDQITNGNSLCDIIMASVPNGQVMEVIEHVLHAITDVGLHYCFPKEWGLSRDSELWKTMQLAIRRGHYVVDSYDDLKRHEPREVYDRVLMQEFAYWFVSTAWDLQQAYGPDEAEWTIRTPGQLKKLYPDFFAVYEHTAARVMHAPSLQALTKLGPTRDGEDLR